MAASDTVTLTIEAPDGTSDEVTLPGRLLEMLADSDTETAPEVAGDLVLFSCAQRIHATVHHSEGESDRELEAVERTTMDLFEDRFGVGFGEATGHDH